MISEAKVITIQVELDKLDETMTKYAPDAGFVEDIEAKARFLAPEAIGLVHSKRTPRVLCPAPGFCGYCGLIAAAEFSGYLIFASSVSALLHKMNEMVIEFQSELAEEGFEIQVPREEDYADI